MIQHHINLADKSVVIYQAPKKEVLETDEQKMIELRKEIQDIIISRTPEREF